MAPPLGRAPSVRLRSCCSAIAAQETPVLVRLASSKCASRQPVSTGKKPERVNPLMEKSGSVQGETLVVDGAAATVEPLLRAADDDDEAPKPATDVDDAAAAAAAAPAWVLQMLYFWSTGAVAPVVKFVPVFFSARLGWSAAEIGRGKSDPQMERFAHAFQCGPRPHA